jgi:cytochrome P450
MNLRRFFPSKAHTRFKEFSIRRTLFGRRLDVHRFETARALFSKKAQSRYRPLAALVRSGVHHRVMIVADGENWGQTHEAIAPHLHAGPVANRHAPVIVSVAERAFAELAERSATAGPVPAPVDLEVESLMRTVTASVMGQVVFGRALSLTEADELQKMLSVCSQEIRVGAPALINWLGAVGLRILNLSQYQRFIFPPAQRKALTHVLDWMGNQFDAPPESGSSKTMLDSLRSRFAGLSPPAERRRIAAECAMMFIAGVETTAAALTFAIAEIANNSTIRDALVAEVRRERAEPGAADGVTADYPYVYQVLRETLRRHTIVPTMLREAESDQEIRGTKPGADGETQVKVKRGTVLRYLSVQGNLRRTLWPDAHHFKPERFAEPLTAEQRRNYHTFGIGPQSCPGRLLAIAEIILILRAFFQKLELLPTALSQPIPVERTALLTIRPVGVTARVRAFDRNNVG